MCSLNKTPFYFYKLPDLTKYLKKKKHNLLFKIISAMYVTVLSQTLKP